MTRIYSNDGTFFSANRSRSSRDLALEIGGRTIWVPASEVPGVIAALIEVSGVAPEALEALEAAEEASRIVAELEAWVAHLELLTPDTALLRKLRSIMRPKTTVPVASSIGRSIGGVTIDHFEVYNGSVSLHDSDRGILADLPLPTAAARPLSGAEIAEALASATVEVDR